MLRAEDPLAAYEQAARTCGMGCSAALPALRRGAATFLLGHVTAPVSVSCVLGAYLVLPPVWWALMIGSGSMLSMMARMSSGLSHSQSCSW